MKTPTRLAGIALILCFTLALAANAAEEPASAENDAGAVSADATDAAAETAGTSTFGPGMQIPVDGTSLEAFDASLAEIKKKTTTTEYTMLTNSIGYLMVYDLRANGDRAKLAASLNGKTGEQIVAMMESRRKD